MIIDFVYSSEVICRMNRWCALYAFLTLWLLILSGCGGNREVNVQQVDSEAKQTSRIEELNALMLKNAASMRVDRDADYVIGADDVLDIDVFQADELKTTAKVSNQGFISMPLVGEIKAKGLTPRQLEKAISAKLEKYLQEPRVSVTVKEYKAQRIAVIGAVGKPNMYVVTGQRYLLDMLIMAGGLSNSAEVCYILRPSVDKKTGEVKTETLAINLTELIEKGDFSLNVPVFSGDVINVPKSGLVFVDGEVNRPGPFQLLPRMTVREAIITAGGLKFEADPKDVRILRDKGNGKREIITLNYNDIKNGKRDDVFVKGDDIIVVGTNGFKNFIAQFFRLVTGTVNTSSGASMGLGSPR
jgi:polysaccharide export outer membrane protein